MLQFWLVHEYQPISTTKRFKHVQTHRTNAVLLDVFELLVFTVGPSESVWSRPTSSAWNDGYPNVEASWLPVSMLCFLTVLGQQVHVQNTNVSTGYRCQRKATFKKNEAWRWKLPINAIKCSVQYLKIGTPSRHWGSRSKWLCPKVSRTPNAPMLHHHGPILLQNIVAL